MAVSIRTYAIWFPRARTNDQALSDARAMRAIQAACYRRSYAPLIG